MHTLLLTHNALIVHAGPVYRMAAVVLMLVAPKEPSCQAAGKLVKIITVGITFAFSFAGRRSGVNLRAPQSHTLDVIPNQEQHGPGRKAEVGKRLEKLKRSLEKGCRDDPLPRRDAA